MSVEAGIHSRYANYQPLTSRIAATKCFTGNAPTRMTYDENGVALGEVLDVEPPYITIHRQGSTTERTSSGLRLEAITYQWNVWDADLERAKTVANLLIDRFDREAFEYDVGRVLDCKFNGRSESQDAGQTWHITLDSLIRTAEPSRQVA